METEWILDVLADLRTFARENGLPALAEQLDETCLLATIEIASTAEGQAGHERAAADSKVGRVAELLGEGV
ncbi:hypothetical protein A3731_35815 [Roseovarius sp. HI0049]|nr:hypothetical protein A3731_17680 [Roseovarius sp. HI0049]KZY41760.1 hypothetical protein A3731_35815 [Roseovarius sp. HI0049]